MANQVIPIADSPNQTFQVTLEDVIYTLTLRWNDRVGAWHLRVGDVDETTLIDGITVTLNYPLMYGFETVGRPPGEFYVVDPAQAQVTDPGRTAWSADGEDLRFVYMESE